MNKTRIPYCDLTWNPTSGCSFACSYCYMSRLNHRFHRSFEPTCHPERLDEPLRLKKSARIFIDSAGDLFDPAIPDWFIFAVWRTIAMSPQHTFISLTKRADRMLQWFGLLADRGPADVGFVGSRDGKRTECPHRISEADATRVLSSGRAKMFYAMVDSWGEPPSGYCRPTYDWAEGPRWWPTVLPNLWLGVTAENQAAADERIPLLLRTPTAVRWLSLEPLLGPIDMETTEGALWSDARNTSFPFGISWVVIGAQTGPHARPCDPAWVESIIAQCRASGVPVWIKGQLHEKFPITEFPEVPT